MIDQQVNDLMHSTRRITAITTKGRSSLRELITTYTYYLQKSYPDMVDRVRFNRIIEPICGHRKNRHGEWVRYLKLTRYEVDKPIPSRRPVASDREWIVRLGSECEWIEDHAPWLPGVIGMTDQLTHTGYTLIRRGVYRKTRQLYWLWQLEDHRVKITMHLSGIPVG